MVPVPGRSRYEIHVGGVPVGRTVYLDRGGQRVFHHTRIEDAFGGRGLAGRLVQGALEDTRASGMRIVPVCPYVGKYLEKHGGTYGDITDPVTPDVLDWLDRRLACPGAGPDGCAAARRGAGLDASPHPGPCRPDRTGPRPGRAAADPRAAGARWDGVGRPRTPPGVTPRSGRAAPPLPVAARRRTGGDGAGRLASGGWSCC
ncbi:N-acetyltransferase [Streptomyces fradiae ATCC 10745 = DSM 40063]|nr:N-acetyltransferase [Streptomyces fradiae ATCC 10745 = DSM 40063]